MPINDLPSRVTNPERPASQPPLILDSHSQVALNRVTRLAVRLLNVSAALISLIEDGQQTIISRAGPAAPSQYPLPLPELFWRRNGGSDQAITVADTGQDPSAQAATVTLNDIIIRAYASVPMLTSTGEVVGALCAVCTAPRAWTADDLATLQDLSALAATQIELHTTVQAKQSLETLLDRQSQQYSVELAQREEVLRAETTERQNAQQRMRRQNRYLVAINEVAVATIHGRNLTELLNIIVDQAASLVEFADSLIWLVDPDSAGLTMQAATGSIRLHVGLRLRSGEGGAGKVWQSNQPLIIEDYATWLHQIHGDGYENFHASVQMPLRSEGKVLGVLGICHTQADKTFEPQDLALFERFTEITAIAIVNAQTITALHEELAERQRTDTLLEQERNLLRTLIDNLPDHIFVKDTEGRYTISNLAHTNTIRLISALDIIGKLPAELFPPGPAEQLHTEDMAILRSGQAVMDSERLLPDMTGTRHWLLSSKIPFRDTQGNLLGLIGITRDITQRKEAALQLEQERNLLRTLIDNIPEYIFVKDMQGSFIISNTALTRATAAISDTNIVGKMLADVYSTELAQRLHAEDENILSTGQALLDDERMLLDDAGNPHWLLASKIPLTDAQGQIVGLVGITRDVTQRKQAELQLEQDRNLLRTLIDNIPDYIFVKDAQGRYVLSNKAHNQAIRLYTDKDIIGKLPTEMFPDEIGEQLHMRDMEVMTSEPPVTHVEHLTPDLFGMPRWVITTHVQLRDAQGQILGLVGITRDIHERKQAELQLEQERNLLRTLIDNIPDYIFAKDTQGRFLISNEAHTLASNASNDASIVDRLPTDRFPVQLGEKFHADDMSILDSGQPLINVEWLTIDAAGNPRWVLTTKVPLKDKHGQLIGLVGISRDITSSKEIEEELQASAIENAQLYDRLVHHADELERHVAERTKELQAAKEQAEAILDTSSDAILVSGPEGLIEQVNPAFNQLFGYPVVEALNQPLQTLADDGSIEKLRDTLLYVVQTGQSQRLEIVARRRDGSTFDADLALAPILRPESVTVVGVVCNLRDMTQRKLIEEELRRTLEKERELNELKTRFVSLVSHEFRTPLAIILAASDILKSYGDRLSSTEKQDRFSKIETGVAQMTSLLEDVLTVSKGEAGQLRFNPVPLDLAIFCWDLIGEAQTIWGQHHLFEFTRQGRTTQVFMDPQLLQHILLNLLSNAIKHSPADSTIHFSVECETDSATFRIRDEGSGIPANDQLKLFDAFHRGENVNGIPGTGLGLTIVKQAVLRHGGTIRFESTPNVGTLFVVTIPNRAEPLQP